MFLAGISKKSQLGYFQLFTFLAVFLMPNMRKSNDNAITFALFKMQDLNLEKVLPTLGLFFFC